MKNHAGKLWVQIFLRKLQAIGSDRRKCLECAFGAALVLSLLTGAYFAKLNAVCQQVRADTLRLHVVANSDSEQDQALKLQVRDRMLDEVEMLFANAGDQAEALQAAQQNLPRLQAAAHRAVQACGSEETVRVKLVRMHFPVTHYSTFSLPAGEYDALRVELGQAKGHNWFCVLYPGLCLPSAEKASYPTGEENKLVGGQYEFRFAILDWLNGKQEQTR